MSVSMSENTNDINDQKNPIMIVENEYEDEFTKNLEFKRWLILFVFALIQYLTSFISY